MDTVVTLVKPRMELRTSYLDFYQEWIHSGEEIVPWVVKKDPTNFAEMLQFLDENESSVNLPEGWVPTSTYWLVVNDIRVVGAVNLRHWLNEKLLKTGGHIGYGIRPSERQKGYATELLKQSLLKVRELGIDKALVVCDAINIGSEKTIRNNGGVEDTVYTEEDGNVIKRFWIEA
jgi:predicted acetyltransferase